MYGKLNYTKVQLYIPSSTTSYNLSFCILYKFVTQNTWQLLIKVTVNVILSDPPLKNGNN